MIHLGSRWENIVYPDWLAAVPEGKSKLCIYINTTGNMGEFVVISLRKTDKNIRIAIRGRKGLILPIWNLKRRRKERRK
jgi:hypothetical protein